MGAVAAGAVLGYTSPTGDELKKGFLGFLIGGEEWSWIGSLTPLGCLVMCIPIGKIMDLIGRKTTMLASVLIFTVGWVLIIFANNVAMLMAGRFLTGMAGGTFCVAAPLYTSEIAEKDIRGALGSYFQLQITVGILFVYVVGNFVNPTHTAIACAIVPFLFALAFVFMPESPYYELKKGRENKARHNLQWLRGNEYDITHEMEEMNSTIQEELANPISFSDSWKKTATKKAFLISFGLMFFQQFSGVNAVIFYQADIFKAAHVALDPNVCSIIVGVMQVVATFLSTLAIDKLGRKILLLFSISIMAICTLLLGIFFSLSEATQADVGWLPVASLSVFIIVFSLGFGPIPWMITSEVFPREVKSVASSAAGTFNWLLAFLITKFFSKIAKELGNDGAFYFFAAICVVGCAFVFFIVIETKGKTFTEIQTELGSNSRRVTATSDGVVNEGFSVS